MISFKQYISEVIDWDQNSLFAIGPDKQIRYYHDRKSTMIEHPDAFKDLNFMDRPHSGEIMSGIEVLSADAGDSPATKRPKALSWGRVDHTNGVVHVVTQHGISPYGVNPSEKNKRTREDDVFHRIHALKLLQQHYPDYDVHFGYEGGWGSPRTPKIISFSQAQKELMDHLDQKM